MVTEAMSAMNELALVAEDLRKAAQLLAGTADSLARLFSDNKTPSEETTPQGKPLTLEDVRVILSDRCAKGFGAQVKALIKSYGAKTLKEVSPDVYDELALAAQALGKTEDTGNAG